MAPDPSPAFRNGGPDGAASAAGWFILGVGLAALALLWWAADKYIGPGMGVLPGDKPVKDPNPPTEPGPDEPPPPEKTKPEDGGTDRGGSELRDPDAPGSPVDDAAILRQTLATLLGRGSYTDPSSFMVASKATVDGLMAGKLNALGLLLTGRELKGSGRMGLSHAQAEMLARHPDVAKVLKSMPLRPDREGVAYLIRVGDVFMSLSRAQALLASASGLDDRKVVKTRRDRPEP